MSHMSQCSPRSPRLSKSSGVDGVTRFLYFRKRFLARRTASGTATVLARMLSGTWIGIGVPHSRHVNPMWMIIMSRCGRTSNYQQIIPCIRLQMPRTSLSCQTLLWKARARVRANSKSTFKFMFAPALHHGAALDDPSSVAQTPPPVLAIAVFTGVSGRTIEKSGKLSCRSRLSSCSRGVK